jgi:hypothetical protein
MPTHKTVEVIIRGDIIDNNVLVKIADHLKKLKINADFSSSIAVPPYLIASKKRYPSIAALYGTVFIEDLFHYMNEIEKVCKEEDCEILSKKVF